MRQLLSIGLAGMVGTLLRYWISIVIVRRIGDSFPFSTLVVNAIGCFFAGFLAYLLNERLVTSPITRSAIFIGLLGGFTTFSAYSLQTFALWREGEIGLGIVNILASNVLCLSLVVFGYWVARIV